jgi:hypothetical protein
MTDQQFVVSNQWALASDGIQWILRQRTTRHGEVTWNPRSFVHSTRDILARCMREKGCPSEDAEILLDGLPSTFDEWVAKQAENNVQRISEAPSGQAFIA